MGCYRPAYACPHCGAVREINGRQIDVKEGELAEVDIKALRELDIARDDEFQRRRKKREEGMAKGLPALAQIAKARGYKAGWVFMRAKAKGLNPNWPDVYRAMM